MPCIRISRFQVFVTASFEKITSINPAHLSGRAHEGQVDLVEELYLRRALWVVAPALDEQLVEAVLEGGLVTRDYSIGAEDGSVPSGQSPVFGCGQQLLPFSRPNDMYAEPFFSLYSSSSISLNLLITALDPDSGLKPATHSDQQSNYNTSPKYRRATKRRSNDYTLFLSFW